MREVSQDVGMENLFTWFLVVAIVVFAGVAGLYLLHFASGSHGLSQNPADWAEFGEYVGGTLGGVFGLFAFIGLLITIVRQRVDSERQVKATLDAVVKAHSIETQSDRESILAIAAVANEHASNVGDAFAKPEEAISVTLYAFHNQAVIDDLVVALRSVPVYKVGSGDGVKALLSLQRQIQFLGMAVQSFEKPLADPNIAKMLPTLDDRQAQAVLRQQKSILAGNVKDRVAAIRRDYNSLERAVNPPPIIPTQ